MMKLSDEILMAYADGSLPDGERRDVERAMLRDPEARKRTLMMRTTRLCVREAYDLSNFEKVPQRLSNLFDVVDQPDPSSGGSTPPDVAKMITLLALTQLALLSGPGGAPTFFVIGLLAIIAAAMAVMSIGWNCGLRRAWHDGMALAWGKLQCMMKACSRKWDHVLTQVCEDLNHMGSSTMKGRQTLVLAGKSLTP